MEDPPQELIHRVRPAPCRVHGRMARERGRRALTGSARALLTASLSLLLSGACSRTPASDAPLKMWAFGREGEVVAQLIPEFTRRNPGIRVTVQQVPWTAAHEKLMTAFVGDA